MESPKIPRFTIEDKPSPPNFSQIWEKKSFDENTNNDFKNFYDSLVLNLVNKLRHAPNKFILDSALAYYKRFLNTENQNFTFLSTCNDEVLKLP